ncbi:FAD-dependent oxidoreductase [Candidatus Sumerlaeota bacterium]|nr:FAD-dependent oxidoreductase [Candidatus Sumerlaeota bacterium]
MGTIGTEGNPLRVAIVGSGPTGFYAAGHLFKQQDLNIEVDMFERLPTPYGLVRGGVAPDHATIKNVTKQFDRIAHHPRYRFFGLVELGRDVRIEDLQRHYHMILITTGAQTDRHLDIPGENLPRSHAATEFVAWCNGHPDYRDRKFDLSVDTAVVVGVGNVAMDVARILARSHEELSKTDIADHALAALAESKIKRIVIIGRRGPLQTAFTLPEIRELGDMPNACVEIAERDVELTPLDLEIMQNGLDQQTSRKFEVMQQYAQNHLNGKNRRIIFKFLASPLELIAGPDGGVGSIKIVRNELYRNGDGSVRPRPTDEITELPAGIVFRSVGYRGVALPGVPFDEKRGVVPNAEGRVKDAQNGEWIPGLYTAGWIKRGPSGMIGATKMDSGETVQCMIEDLQAGRVQEPEVAGAEAALEMIRQRRPEFIDFENWQKLDALELKRGQETGRPRVKFTSVPEIMQALNR